MSESEACQVNNVNFAHPGNQVGSEDKKEVWAAIYARTSSPNQRFGYSLGEQIELCRERCKLMGWTVRYIFKEDGVSGKDTDRPRFKNMLEKAMFGGFDVIVFWKLDRFCRSLLDLMNTEKMLNECGVALHSVTEQIDTTTPVGKFNFRNLASAAELERELIKERARMGMHALAKQHRWPNKTPPLGYDLEKDGTLKVNEEEAALVRRIFQMYLELKSMPQVAFLLNREGIRTRLGNHWSEPTVKKVLDNTLYVGGYTVASVEAKIEKYRLLSDELFNEVRESRNRSKKKGRMPPERKEETIEKIFGEYLANLEGGKKERAKFRIV